MPLPEIQQATTDWQRRREHRLVRRLLSGDQGAFREFVDAYLPRLYRFARSRLGSDPAVDEVVQVVLTIVAERLDTFRGEASLYTWLVQICRHEISRHLQRRSRDRDRMMPFLNDELLRAQVERVEAPVDLEPEHAGQRDQLRLQIGLALDQLPENQAAALSLKYVEGYSSKEIACRMGVSDEAVQSLLARARRAFRAVYSDLIAAENDTVSVPRVDLQEGLIDGR